MRIFYLIPALLVILTPFANARSLALKAARICSKEKENPVFIKLIGYPGNTFRVEECSLTGVDEVDCRDIKGYKSNRVFRKGRLNRVLRHGSPARVYDSKPLAEIDRERSKKNFMAALTFDLGYLAQEAKRASAIQYVQDVLWSNPSSQDCQVYEGDFVALMDDLRDELGREKHHFDENAQNDFLMQIIQVESEKNSPRRVKSDRVYYTRTKRGPSGVDLYYIGNELLPQPPETPAISAEQGAPQ